MLNVDTRRKIDSCRDILVGKLPDPKAQIEQITYALIYKFMADMDTASVALGGKASFFVDGYEQYTWDKLMSTNVGGKQRLDLYSEGIAKLALNPHLPQLFRDIFKDAFLPYRDPETLNMFLKEISWFTYNHSEDLGDAFEYLLSVMSSQGDAGQFRTPRHIIDFIVDVVDPKKDETVLDPACGTAGFLISSYKHILQQNTAEKPGDKLTTDEKQDLMSQIVGYDISPDMVRLSLVNMYLHGFPEPHIYEYDTLTDEGRWEDSFDVIMANPPFMSPKGGIRPHKRFSIQANRSEVLFVDYIAEHLMPNGRAGVIVPEGIIFQSGNAYKSLRKMLVDNYLYCVVSLPAGVFNPYSGVKTSILFMDKTLGKQTDKVLFVKIENDGFGLGAQRREIAGSDFPQALTHVKNFVQSVRKGKELSVPDSPNILLVSKQQLAENGDYNFSMERYRKGEKQGTKWDLVELKQICTYIRGVIYQKSDEIEKDGHIILRANNISLNNQLNFSEIKQIARNIELNENLKLKKDDILMCASSGSKEHVGKVAYIEKEIDCYPGGFMGVIRSDTKSIIPKYLFSLLTTQYFRAYIENNIIGVNIQNINSSLINSFSIPLPPLNIQEEIVSEIESYRKIIEGARQVVENYKPQIKIAAEWPMIELGEICTDILSGGTPSTAVESYWNGNIPWITSADIVDANTIVVRKNITQDGLKNSATNLIPKDNIIVVTRVGLGKIAMNKFDVCISQDSQGLILNREKVFPQFLLYILAEKVLIFKNTSQGTTIQGVTKNQLKTIKIPVPALDVQQEIVAQIEKEQQLVDANKQLIQIYEQKIKSKIAEVWET